MAHLGVGGELVFRRQAAASICLSESDCNHSNEQWLPPATRLLTGDQMNGEAGPLWANVDELGYHSLYRDLFEAFEGDPADRVKLKDVLGKAFSPVPAVACECVLADWTFYEGRSSFSTAEVEQRFGEAIGSLACAALVANFYYFTDDSGGLPDWRAVQLFDVAARQGESAACFLDLCDEPELGRRYGFKASGLVSDVAINSRQLAERQLAGTAEIVFIETPRLAFSSG